MKLFQVFAFFPTYLMYPFKLPLSGICHLTSGSMLVQAYTHERTGKHSDGTATEKQNLGCHPVHLPALKSFT